MFIRLLENGIPQEVAQWTANSFEAENVNFGKKYTYENGVLSELVEVHERTVQQAKSEKLFELDRKKMEKIENGVPFLGFVFSIHEQAVQNWLGIATMINLQSLPNTANIPPIFSKDGNEHMLTVTEFKDFFAVASFAYSQILQQYEQQRTQIVSLQTVSDIDSFVIL